MRFAKRLICKEKPLKLSKSLEIKCVLNGKYMRR